MKIGFFDSGVGGLLVMERVRALLPEYDYVFYGDRKHVPYGDRSEDEIYAFTREAIIGLLHEYECKLVVVACNTASAETLRRLQDTLIRDEFPDRRVLGVIIPTIEVLMESEYARPLLIGTTRTVISGKYERELLKINTSLTLKVRATPELVPLIEKGRKDEAVSILAPILCDHIEGGGDAVILGCTHYSALTPYLRERYATQLYFFSQDEIIPEKLLLYLERHPEIERALSRGGTEKVLWSR